MFGVASMMERAQDEYALALAPSLIGMLNLSDFWHMVEAGQDSGIEAVGLGEAAGGLGEVPGLAGVDHRHRDPRCGEGGGGALVAASRLEDDQLGTCLPSRLRRESMPSWSLATAKASSRGSKQTSRRSLETSIPT